MNNLTNKTVAIVGYTGFIGSSLFDFFAKNNCNIICLGKKNNILKKSNKVSFVQFDLLDIKDSKIPSDIDLLINAAYIKHSDNNIKNINYSSALKIEEICIEKGIKHIFLSSFSANKNSLSNYGKEKFEIEKALDIEKSLVLRLALVIGKGGLFNNIRNLIKKSRIIPLIGNGNQHIHTIHIDEVGEIIEHLYSNKKSGLFIAGDIHGTKIKNIYREIAKYENKKPIFINIPYIISDIAFFIIDILKINLGVNKENYLGLKCSKKAHNINTKSELGIDVSDYKICIKRLY